MINKDNFRRLKEELMSPQTIKFLTFLQPNYITSIVEIIFLILIYKKLKEISNER